MKVLFAGTPQFAAQALSAILAAGHEVSLVLTQPDRQAGRGMKLRASAVKQLALTHQLPLFQPQSLKDSMSHAEIRAAAADVMIVAAYGLILPQAVLDIPKHGCLNIHASLLPRWRGAAPIQRAIEAGDAKTGVTIMRMEAGLDTGPMLLAEHLPIAPDDTAATLLQKLATQGARLIVAALRDLNRLTPVPQPAEGLTYARKIEKSEAVIDWRLPASTLDRRIRAFNPFPGMVATLRDTPIKLWRANVIGGAATPGKILSVAPEGIDVACGDGALRLYELQKPGSKHLSAAEFIQGYAITPGENFTLPEA